jgi:hypothetical protein
LGINHERKDERGNYAKSDRCTPDYQACCPVLPIAHQGYLKYLETFKDQVHAEQVGNDLQHPNHGGVLSPAPVVLTKIPPSA